MDDIASTCAIYCRRKDFQYFIMGMIGSLLAGTTLWFITKKMEKSTEELPTITRLNRRAI